MKRKKIIPIILAIIAFSVLFLIYLQFQAPRSDVRFELSMLKPLKLVKNEMGEMVISGSVQVKLLNQTNRRIELLNLHEHNLLFSSEQDTVQFIPFHSCSCVQMQQREFIVLEPGKSEIIDFKYWACDGSTFGAPKQGIYMLYFRMHEKSKLSRNSSYAKFHTKRNANIQESIKDCRNLFNDKNFWKEAIYSNSVLVKF